MTNMKANEIKSTINGNCKAVRDITNDIKYNSVMEAAKANGVKNSTMSVAINRGYVCNGNQFMFEKDLHESTDKLCEQLAKANARVAIAENKLSEMDEIRAKAKEYDKLMAEQEAIRKAEEKHQLAVAKAEQKVAQRTEICKQIEAKLQRAVARLMEAEKELNALNGKEVC